MGDLFVAVPCSACGSAGPGCNVCHGAPLLRPATAADLTRDLVRAYLARDPEAAAKVAGVWERNKPSWERDGYAGISHRDDPQGAVVFQVVATMDRRRWCVYDRRGGCLRCWPNDYPTREAAEAAVDELLRAEGWVLGCEPGDVDDGR